MSLQKPKSMHAASKRQKHLAPFQEVQVTFGWYSRMTEGGTRRLIHGLVKLTQFCVSFIALRSLNGSFQTPQSCQFLNRYLFRSSPITKLRDRVCSWSRKALNFEPFHRTERSQVCRFGHVTTLSHIGEASHAMLAHTHGKTVQRSATNQVEWLRFLPCLVPSWRGASRTIWEYCLSIFQVFLGVLTPSTLPTGKGGIE